MTAGEHTLEDRDVQTLRQAARILSREGQSKAAARIHSLADGICAGNAARTAEADAPGKRAAAYLTPSERRVVIECARGGTRADVGRRLHVAPTTVAKHLLHATKRMHATSTTHLVALAIAHGLIPASSALNGTRDA